MTDTSDVLSRITPDVLARMPAAKRAELLALLERRAMLAGLPRQGIPWWSDDLTEILRVLAPKYIFGAMSAEHMAIWDWVASVEPGVQPRPLVVCLPRGRGKSVSLALAVILLGCFRRRRYCLYVSGTQKQGDRHLATISSILESGTIATHFPAMAERQLTKFGQSRGWTQQRLITADGFMVESVGLVESIRGLRNEEVRPDLIVLDDADAWKDSTETIEKKIGAITGAILPAGSTDAASIFVGNMPNAGGLMDHVVNPGKFPEEERFFADRLLVGPVPAVEHLVTEMVENDDGTFRWRIIGGKATWPERQPLEWCEREINRLTLATFKRELQHDTTPPAGGMFGHVKFRRCAWDEVPWAEIVDVQVWCDPALSDKDSADACALAAGGVSASGTIYLFRAWEERSTPSQVLRDAILLAQQLFATIVGVESNQGGSDLWATSYEQVCERLEADDLLSRRIPFDDEKAPSSMSKPERAQQFLLTEYEHGRIVHVVEGGADVVEAALHRFPKTRPYDLVDALGWMVHRLRDVVPIVDLSESVKKDQENTWADPHHVAQPGDRLRNPEITVPEPENLPIVSLLI